MAQSADRRCEQFELERVLRRRILDAAPADRAAAASSVYQELLEKFPDHRRLHFSDEYRRQIGRRGAAMVGPLVRRGSRILEIGCGRGDTLIELARLGHICVGIEPSRHMLEMFASDGGGGVLDDRARSGKRGRENGANAGVTLSPGTAERLDFADESFDLVFSQQTLEHLHPDDVPLHFAEAFRVLRGGGVLAVETPNRHTGPQDCSRGFVREAEGLHLKEWTYGELAREFGRAGFVAVRGQVLPPVVVSRSALLHRVSRVPAFVKRIQEGLIRLVPGLELRTRVARGLGVDDVFLFGWKPQVNER